MCVSSLPKINKQKTLRSAPVLYGYLSSFGSQSQQGKLHKKDLVFLDGGFPGKAEVGERNGRGRV